MSLKSRTRVEPRIRNGLFRASATVRFATGAKHVGPTEVVHTALAVNPVGRLATGSALNAFIAERLGQTTVPTPPIVRVVQTVKLFVTRKPLTVRLSRSTPFAGRTPNGFAKVFDGPVDTWLMSYLLR